MRERLLRQQIIDAQRTGDLEYAKELLAELEAGDMDQNPEDDEEALEQIYELPAEVADELSHPLAASLADDIFGVLNALSGNKAYRIDATTVGVSGDVYASDFLRSLDNPVRTRQHQKVKMGLDEIQYFKLGSTNLELGLDFHGRVDYVRVF